MLIYILLIAGLVVLDQITKIIIVNSINYAHSITIIKDFFYLTYVRNTGAAWSKFEGQMTLFYIVTVIALGIFSYLLVKEGDFDSKKIFTISIIFMIAGTLGNFIDRLLYQYVIDFFEFNIFGYHFPVFNVADILLTLGTIGFAYTIIVLKQ